MAHRVTQIFTCPDVFARLAASAGSALMAFIRGETGAVSRSVQSKLREVMFVEDFGAVGDGVTDDSTALRNAAAAIRTLGGGTLRFGFAKNYKVWSVSDTARILDFRGASGIVIEGNGSTIVSGLANTVAAAYFIDATAVVGVAIRALNFTGGNTTLVPAGEQFIIGANGTTNVTLANCVIKNCQVGINYGSGANDNVGLFIYNVVFNKVYYPLNIYQTTLIRAQYQAINCGRAIVLVAPINDADYSIDSQQGSAFSDVVIGGYADSTKTVAYNTLSNIRVNYRTAGRFPGSGNQSTAEGLVTFQFTQLNAISAALHLRNVDINITADASGTDKPSNAFTILKYTNGGVGDTAARGHTLRHVTIRASLLNWNNATVDGLNLFPVSLGGQTFAWTGDTVENFALRDVRIVGAAPTDGIYVNGQGAVAGKTFLTFDNVTADGNTTLANTTSARIVGLLQPFTPGISFGGASVGVTYSQQVGQFAIRDGRVRGNGTFNLTSKGSSVGAARITGLPFAVGSGNQSYSPVSLRFAVVTFAGQFQGFCEPGATTIALDRQTETGVQGALTDANFDNTSTVMVAFDYPLYP